MRRLEAPWSTEKTEVGYRVRDSHRTHPLLSLLSGRRENAEVANVLTWEGDRSVALPNCPCTYIMYRVVEWDAISCGTCIGPDTGFIHPASHG